MSGVDDYPSVFADRIGHLRNEAVREIESAINAKVSKATADGLAGHGRLPIVLVEAVSPICQRLTQSMLRDLDRGAKLHPSLEPTLYRIVESKLADLGSILMGMDRLRPARAPVAAKPLYDAEVQRLVDGLQKIVVHHRQGFDVGLTELPAAGDSITLNNSSAVIQQGGVGNNQSATLTVNLAAAKDAAAELDRVIIAADLAADIRDDLQADLLAIKAQLRKAAPSTGVMLEAAKSLRTIAEGAAGGAIIAAPQIMVALHALYQSLGLT